MIKRIKLDSKNVFIFTLSSESNYHCRLHSMSMREKKKKVHFTKVSEVDYKILILENRELLSLKEQEKLQSLKERKVLLESNGMVGLKSASVPTAWILGTSDPPVPTAKKDVNKETNLEVVNQREENEIKPAEVQDDQDKNNGEGSPVVFGLASTDPPDGGPTVSPDIMDPIGDNRGRKKQGGQKRQAFSNAYLQFLSEKKAKLFLVDPEAKLNLKEVRGEWNSLEDALKAPYKNKAIDEKMMLGNNFRKDIQDKSLKRKLEEQKQSKSERNKKYRKQLQNKKSQKIEEEKYCSNKFEVILKKKDDQLSLEYQTKESLIESLGKIETDGSLVGDMIKEKESEVIVLREKYRGLYRIHKACSLSNSTLN